MNTQRENSTPIEGVIDVGILTPACFENPLKEASIKFLAETLTQKRKNVIPTTTIIGAYHIATRYIRAPKLAVKKILVGMMKTRSPALYPYVSPELAEEAVEHATAYNIESWDGYLIALAKSQGSNILYTMDEALREIPGITAVNPFPPEKVKEYHNYIAKTI